MINNLGVNPFFQGFMLQPFNQPAPPPLQAVMFSGRENAETSSAFGFAGRFWSEPCQGIPKDGSEVHMGEKIFLDTVGVFIQTKHLI